MLLGFLIAAASRVAELGLQSAGSVVVARGSRIRDGTRDWQEDS